MRHVVESKRRVDAKKHRQIAAREKQVMKFRKEGLTYTQIAHRMKTTKGAIAGIINRTNQPKKEIAVVARGDNNRMNVVTLPVLDARPVPTGNGKGYTKKQRALLDSGQPGTCQWLEGEATDRKFCGAPSPNDVWCAVHKRRVFATCNTPAQPRSSRVSLKLPPTVKQLLLQP